jgi:4-hydroxy-3-methylbut-2-enyl diphosphate reductase
VDRLNRQGMVAVESISSIPEGESLVVRTHGLQREIVQAARDRHLEVIDFTCPKVKKIHGLVQELNEEGYLIHIVGNPDHPEVRAIRSLVPEDHSRVIQAVKDVPAQFARRSGGDRNAVVVQTTFNPSLFYDIVRDLVMVSTKTLVMNTLCEETIRRQREARRLAGEVDCIIVVGGKNSSNTKTLFEAVKERVPALHITGTEEIDMEKLRRYGRLGIISGASTPREHAIEVRDRILTVLSDSG